MKSNYVLMTAAYNEQEYIANTLESVISQTCQPRCWLIVSDGSTDRTDEIIKKYEKRHGFIRFSRQEKRAEDKKRLEKASIAKARAMQSAIIMMADQEYEFIGNLDADTTLEPDYYERVLEKFKTDPELGIAGGGVYTVFEGEKNNGPEGFVNPDFVGGPVQLFRRDCIEQLGGYLPFGHDDCIAVARAHMNGWKVKCYPEIHAYQYGMPQNSIAEKVPICFNMGRMDYLMGGLFTFEILRCLHRMAHRPYIFAGASLFLGYLWAALSPEKIRLFKEIQDYMQLEQIEKLESKIPTFKFIRSVARFEARHLWGNTLSE
jgi:glycosyltransferase involved in cell wall biosynthesis